MLGSDRVLFDYVKDHLRKGRDLLTSLTQALEILSVIRSCLSAFPEIPQSSLYVKAFWNKIVGSYMIRDLLLATQKANMEDLNNLLETLLTLVDKKNHASLNELLNQGSKSATTKEKATGSSRTLKSHKKGQGTAGSIDEKVISNKKYQSLNNDNQKLARMRIGTQKFLEAFFAEIFVDPRKVFLAEILVFDTKSPLREAFMPRPRFTLERALSAPHDYLNCSCCFPGGTADSDETVCLTFLPIYILGAD